MNVPTNKSEKNSVAASAAGISTTPPRSPTGNRTKVIHDDEVQPLARKTSIAPAAAKKRRDVTKSGVKRTSTSSTKSKKQSRGSILKNEVKADPEGVHEQAASARRSSTVSFDDGNNELFQLDMEEGSSIGQSSKGSWMSGSSSDDDDSAHALFQKARMLLNPSAMYWRIMYLYAERKMVVFFGIHFVSTMIIWGHFALVKFSTQRETVPAAVPRYLWKIVAPSLEFGSMHAILFQMSLIPITMARFSISALSDSFIDKLIPLNRALRMHIHLGYTMITIVFFAVLFFFTFFGLLCSDGDQDFCDKFTAEIMITGYVILGFLLIIGVTSYCRHMIPYEIFYAIHHLVFIMYFVTIAHTIDIEQRKGLSERSQTFRWFSSTLLFYFCDRIAMRLNRRFTTNLATSSTVSGSNGSRMIILKMERPVLFRFKPGQYAFLQIDGLDNLKDVDKALVEVTLRFSTRVSRGRGFGIPILILLTPPHF